MKRDPIVHDALEFQKLSAEAFGGQRQRENDALEFQVPEKQWPSDVRVQRAGQTTNGVPIPARPMLSIPSLQQPIQSIYNQWSRAHFGIQIHPRSTDADDETAAVIQDLYRQIEVDSRAYIGRGWGFDRALKAGFGAYRVEACYDDSSDDPDDQKLKISRILRQSSVYWDPFSVEPDFCDQKRCLVVSFISMADFKREFPDAALGAYTSEELITMQSEVPNWARLNSSGQRSEGQEKWYDQQNDTVCIAEFFRTEYEDEELKDSPRKSKKVPKIWWYKINAVEVLEKQLMDCAYIPIIPCIGNELQPFDPERRWMGIIEPNADAARLLNYEVSNAVETDALRPKAPFIGAVGQFKTNNAAWQQANVRNWPYLEYDPVMAGGQIANPPQRQETSVDLSSSIALIQLAKESLQTGTAVIDASSLENLARKKVAHQTLGAMAESNETSQSGFIQNMADITMTYEAKVVLSWLPKIYDRPGRRVTVRNEKDEPRQVLLGQPYVTDPKTKRPIAVPNGSNPMPANGMKPPKPKYHDLQKGQYGVVVSVGKSYQTRAQQGSDSLGELIKAVPEAAPALLPIWARFQDFPGHKEVESVLKKLQPPQLQQPEDGEPEDAETLKMQRDQAMQIADQLKQQLQQAAQAIQTDQAKQQATLQKAQLDAQSELQVEQLRQQTELQKAQMQMETQVRIAQMKAQADKELAAAQMAHDDMDREDTQRFEHAEAAVDRHHENVQLAAAHAQAEAQASQEHRQALEAGEQGHEQAVDMLEREPKEASDG